jgi:hypothetical protein
METRLTTSSPGAAAPHADPRTALARSIGLAAFVYGYPLLETMRSCRLQTDTATPGVAAARRAPIDEPLHWAGPTQASDRDIVTPANDLMYTTAWIHLADGPRWLNVPAAAEHPGRYFVLALYDAYTENFENLGLRNCRAEGERVLLVGPDGKPPLPSGVRILRAPTNLVWMIARVLVVDADDLPSAKQLQASIGIEPLPGTGRGHRPACVEQWLGEAVDPIAAVLEHGEGREPVAMRFFSNLSRALADAPGRVEDQGLVAWFGSAGLRPGTGFDWRTLDAPSREGLLQGFNDGLDLIAASAQHRQARPWVLSWRNGRYGNHYLTRAVVSYIGLGALATDEALYAAGHFDADGQLLDGRQPYTLRFEAGELPPAHAFWSVTLYAADRFLYANPLRRHAIGDRTQGLKRDADGGLTLSISNKAPADNPNWLPAPAGRFYLILRLYHPRDDVRGWRIPPLQRLAA